LSTRHLPEQQVDPNNPSSTDHTTWSYYADDTMQSITDARGASATYIYNNGRHLANEIHFSAPSGITTVSNVTFGYDAAGARNSMSDQSGTLTYHYDQLSRLDWEERTFAGLAGSFRLSYAYNLAGELKTITEPGGSYAEYGYDSVGRLARVTGSGLGASQYVSSMQYRAWGALKSLSYGNSTTFTLGYDNRRQPTHYAVGGVRSYANGPIQPEGSDFQYYDDGQIKFASDLRTDATAYGLHDRAYSYDQAARLKEAYSGYEARDFLNGTNSGIHDGAFRQSYGYDAWNNLTSRTGRFWSEDDSATDSYNNQNRNPAWDYDSDGRLLSTNEPPPNSFPYQPLRYTYDAAGRRYQSTQTTSRQVVTSTVFTTAVTKTETYDGVGTLVKSARITQLNNNTPATATTFFLRSSLTGNVITEYDSAGNRQSAYVFAGREIVAQQQRFLDGSTQLIWQHVNPITGDGLSTDAQGTAWGRTNVDPMGVNVGDTDVFASNQPTNGGEGGGMGQAAIDAMVASLIPGWGGPKCKVDGMLTGCRFASAVSSSGAGVPVTPGTNTASRLVIYQGKVVAATYRATDDGYQGFIPVTARYVGNGNFIPSNSGGPPTRGTNSLHDTNFARLNGATGEAHLALSQDSTLDPQLQNVGFNPKKPECLPLDVKNQLQQIYSRTQLADTAGRLQEYGFTTEPSGSSMSPTTIRDGKVNEHLVNLEINTSTVFAAHSHGKFDEVGASEPDLEMVRYLADPKQTGMQAKFLPIYIVSRAGIVLFDINDKSTQRRTPGGEPGHPSYGLIVGQLSGNNSIFKKPCVPEQRAQ
jgi:YD repeat-containing protein